MKLLIEATIIGLMAVVIESIFGFLIGKSFSANLPKICKQRNLTHVMEICLLFFTGFLIHILCESFRANKWYCKNGNAYLKK